jgi:histidyl-tRNA synthetase
MRANEFITELFTHPAQWEWTFRGSEESLAQFTIGGIKYIFHAYSDIYDNLGIWEVEFKIAGRGNLRQKFGLTGTGNSAEVMSTVVSILKEFLQDRGDAVKVLRFTAKEGSRKALYARMVKRLLPDWEMSISGAENEFSLSRPVMQSASELK